MGGAFLPFTQTRDQERVPVPPFLGGKKKLIFVPLTSVLVPMQLQVKHSTTVSVLFCIKKQNGPKKGPFCMTRQSRTGQFCTAFDIHWTMTRIDVK